MQTTLNFEAGFVQVTLKSVWEMLDVKLKQIFDSLRYSLDYITTMIVFGMIFVCYFI